jgi:hypothetical protein
MSATPQDVSAQMPSPAATGMPNDDHLQAFINQYQGELDSDTQGLKDLTQQGQPEPFTQQAPERNTGIMSVAPFLIGLAALGGKATGLHATTMLGATNGMVKGLIQGSEQAYTDHKKAYDEAYNKWLDKWTQQQKIYNEMRQVYKGRIDADLKALQFARQVTGDNAKVTQNDLKNHQNAQVIADKFTKTNETIRHDLAIEHIQGEKAARQPGPKVPSGYEVDPEHPDQLRPIKGGPKDPNAPGQQGAREAVFTGRMITSANEAVKSVHNIMRLPVSANKGVFGNVKGGDSLHDAPKAALANTMTSQEDQVYKVMMSGVTRNLATIEAVGLMPSGSLTHQMDAIEFQPGQDYLTRLSQMAEIKQIVNGALEPITNNPRVPDQTKQFVKDIVEKMGKEIPFTQDDVIDLMQSKNPQATIMDFARSRGVAKPPADPQQEERKSLGGKSYVKKNGQWYEDAGNAPTG